MQKEALFEGIGRIMGALVTSAALVFGTAYLCRMLIVKPAIQAQSQPIPSTGHGIKTVLNQ